MTPPANLTAACRICPRARGQSSMEYLVALALVTALVAVPIDGYPSVVAELLDAISTAFARLLAALSLPM